MNLAFIMEYLTLLLFVVICYGLGFTILKWVNFQSEVLERHIMFFAIGLSAIPILGVILSFVGIPLYWWIFLILSLALPLSLLIISIIKNQKNQHQTGHEQREQHKQHNQEEHNKEQEKTYTFNIKESAITHLKTLNNLKITKSTIYIFIVILMFLAILYVMNKGAFVSPWLEDGDSWGHMGYAKYIEIEKTIYNPKDIIVSHYAAPYPPGYDLIMGVFFQISDSPYWTMKFFNILFISLATIFIYFFVKEFTGDKNIALFSSLILTIIPSFLSHFIWSHTLGVVLFFPALYCIKKLDIDKTWLLPAIIVISSILVTVPVTAFYFGAFLGLYWLGKVIATRKLNVSILLAGIGGLLLSLIFWVHMFIIYGLDGVFKHLRLFRDGAISFKKIITLQGTGGVGGEANYKIMDFVWVNTYNMINNPKGIGLMLSFIVMIGIICIIYLLIKEHKHFFKEENSWIIISFILFIFTLLSVLGQYFPIRMPYPFRAWSYLAIPVAIIGSLGYFKLVEWAKKIQIPHLLIFIVIFSGLLLTSGYQKYTVNTAIWNNENFYSLDEVQPYLWMKDNLPKNTKVLSYCGDWLDVLSYDKLQEGWKPEISAFYNNVVNMTTQDVVSFMKTNEYNYLIVDAQCVKKYNATFANERLQEAIATGMFEPAYDSQVGVILKKV